MLVNFLAVEIKPNPCSLAVVLYSSLWEFWLSTTFAVHIRVVHTDPLCCGEQNCYLSNAI